MNPHNTFNISDHNSKRHKERKISEDSRSEKQFRKVVQIKK